MTTPIPAAGWKPMPTTMTLEMSVAFAEAWFSKVRCIDDHEMQDAYAAMLAAAPSPATVAPGDAQDERSPTHGMTLGERIAHVGGRTNGQGYTEFGSPMAVNALIQHVLRDIDWTRQDDDGAYQARYRLPGGQWSSWGHVVCGVKGHEQELRYLPGERRPAPAAGDALDEDAVQAHTEGYKLGLAQRTSQDAQDAARYRTVRQSIADEENGADQVAAASAAIGLTRGSYPTPEQFDAIVDHIAAQVPQQGEA